MSEMSLMRGARWSVAAIALAGCGAAETPAGDSAGVFTEIVSAIPDDGGYAVTVRVTNADTGEIGYGPFCPGRLQEQYGVGWLTVTDMTGICRSSLHGVDRGKASTFTLHNQPIGRGSLIRFITSWVWVNGDGHQGDGRTSTSRPARGE